jgi:outer membrane protein assembly factor BamB
MSQPSATLIKYVRPLSCRVIAMKPLASLAFLVLLAPCVTAQTARARLYTNPSPPTREVLDRLNLKQAWAVSIPVLDRRDGLLSVQVAPVYEGKTVTMQVLAQTRSGLVSILDAETGRVRWSTRVGKPNTGDYPLGFNRTTVVAERGTRVYGIDRQSGSIRWQLDPKGAISAAPLAGGGFLYLPLGAREVDYYDLPARGELEPRLFRRYLSPVTLEMMPSQTTGFLIYPSPRGTVSVLTKDNPGLLLRFRIVGGLLAPPGVHEGEQIVYIGSGDGYLSANPILTGEATWRFTTSGPVTRRPFVNETDVYTVAEGRGLYLLRRRTLTGTELTDYLDRTGFVPRGQLQEVVKDLGKSVDDSGSVLTALQRKGYLSERQRERVHFRGGTDVWLAPEGDRVLATNPKFVYAADRTGRLLVLDRLRGRRLSLYNNRDFTVPVVNELTDRLFLAANNGLIVCLHDREYDTPVTMKTVPEPARIVGPGKLGGGKPGPKPPPKPVPPGGGIMPRR